ncbi:Usher syndrome type-1G protein homolog isoform X1 [Tribolium madens]|uniref:Usher syndrome type-1G protein homolog isoform X1 n=1 Tax=Tribolium madens TaxID=41895 RepID=UPI001CF761A7|nr:Usher syndrome type-1G protein homolog isoform X1 [Tribolium madens]
MKEMKSFSRAAKDGMIEVLKEATKRDCNGRDEQGMTPTLYAAFYGNLEALRLLCGRGGDPDKADLFGNTALHLAAAQGHKHIVTFLVNFGANIYSTDIDGRTAQELAGMNNRDDILRFLDGVHAKLEAGDKKKAKTLKEKAKKESEKRIKEFNKRQVKKEQVQEKLEKRMNKGHHRPSMIETLKTRIKSGSMSNLANLGPAPPRFSTIVGNGTVSGMRNLGSVQRRVLASRTTRPGFDDDFKVSEIEDGKRSVRSLTGYRRDSEVLYTGTIDGRRGRLESVFNEAEYIDSSPPPPPSSNGLIRSMSQPDFMHELETNGDNKIQQEPASIFVRPGIGSIAFRKSITNTFQGFYSSEGPNEESSIGSGESYGPRTNTLSIDELTDPESSDDDNPNAPLERFLTAWGLGEYLPRFEEQKIDLDTLMILTENDLLSLKLPLGPHRKLVTAVSERKAALENPGEVTDSML